MANYSFNGTNSYSRDYASSTAYASRASRAQSPSQAGYYNSLCKQHNLEPKVGFSLWDYETMSHEIQLLKDLKVAISDKQIEIINKIIERNSFKMEVDFSKLTGGRDGSASKFIEQLFKLEEANKANLPVTENQLTLLLNMFACPDANFADLGIDKFIPREHEGHVYKYKLSADEVAQAILDKVSQADASAFIAKYRDLYYGWKQTRLTIKQQEHIRTLEARMMGTSSAGVEDEIFVTFEGERMSMSQLTGKINKEWAPKGYEPLSDLAIAQLSKEGAQEYIDRLNWELSPAGREKIMGSSFVEDETFEMLRKKDADSAEQDALRTIVHSLLASMGENATQEDELIPMALCDFEKDSQADALRALRDLFNAVIDMGSIDFEDLFEMCKPSKIATQVLIKGL
jgi:hypothetical protein